MAGIRPIPVRITATGSQVPGLASWGRVHLAGLITLGRGASLHGQLALAWDALISLLFALAGGLTVIALMDFPIQWLRRFLRLRMRQQLSSRFAQVDTRVAASKSTLSFLQAQIAAWNGKGTG